MWLRTNDKAAVSSPKSLIATEEVPLTLRALPSLSYLQWPSHSPMSFLFYIVIKGMLFALARAVISFLYLGSSQFSANMQRTASLRSRALQTSLRPLTRPKLEISSGLYMSLNFWHTKINPEAAPAKSKKAVSALNASVACLPSVLVWRVCHLKALLTIINMRLSNHTLDGIMDVVGFFFFNWSSLGNVTSQKLAKSNTTVKLTLRCRTS